jgi:cytochrome c oxidase assembly protein subunit 15
MNDSSKFLRWARYSLILVYLVILAGAVVRATGSGMGCPDWPKCFGFWIPPTDVSQLPSNYQKIYAEHSYADNHFNPLKTWIEYINRLLGALLGLFVLALFFLSFRFIKSHPESFSSVLLNWCSWAFRPGWVNWWWPPTCRPLKLPPICLPPCLLLPSC